MFPKKPTGDMCIGGRCVKQEQ